MSRDAYSCEIGSHYPIKTTFTILASLFLDLFMGEAISTKVGSSKQLQSNGSRLCALLRRPHLRWSSAVNMKVKDLVPGTVGFAESSNETSNDPVSSSATNEDPDCPMNSLNSITESTGDQTVDAFDAT